MRHVVLPLVLFLSLGVCVPTVAEADVAVDSPRLVDEIAGLRASVDEMVDLLDRFMSYQKTDLMLKRMEFKRRQLEPLERELRDRTSDLESRQEEIDQLDVIREQLENGIQDDIRSGVDTPDSDNRRFEKELEIRRKLIDDRLAELEQRVLELENDLADRLDEIADLEDMLDKLLDE